MTYVVTENCIKCKYMDCVEVCPVDCFYEGENMLVIHPDECIDCGVCEPECPAEAIKPDTEPGLESWLQLNTEICLLLAQHHPEEGSARRRQGVRRRRRQARGAFLAEPRRRRLSARARDVRMLALTKPAALSGAPVPNSRLPLIRRVFCAMHMHTVAFVPPAPARFSQSGRPLYADDAGHRPLRRSVARLLRRGHARNDRLKGSVRRRAGSRSRASGRVSPVIRPEAEIASPRQAVRSGVVTACPR